MRFRPDRLGMLLAILMAPACARFERSETCRQLARAVNPALDEIERIEQKKGSTPADYRQAARRYSRLADEISRIQLQGDELPIEVRQYRESMIRAAELVRQAADSLEGGRSAQLDAVRRELTSLDQRQRHQTRRIETICRSGGRDG